MGGGIATLRSPPFSDRELNGTQLLSELAALRGGGVTTAHLVACEQALKGLDHLPAAQAVERLNEVALNQVAGTPPLAQVLLRWARHVKLPGDPAALREHMSRMAIASALLAAMWKAAPQLAARKA